MVYQLVVGPTIPVVYGCWDLVSFPLSGSLQLGYCFIPQCFLSRKISSVRNAGLTKSVQSYTNGWKSQLHISQKSEHCSEVVLVIKAQFLE